MEQVLTVKRMTKQTLIEAGGFGARVTSCAGSWGFWSNGKRYDYNERTEAEAAASKFVAVASTLQRYLAGYGWATVSNAAIRDMAELISNVLRDLSLKDATEEELS